ncbi:MAG: S9 family peptidase, partial [Actinomycetota bacterium]
MSDSFPRQYARTHGFNLGNPRSIEVAPDGARVTFLRTPAGDDTNAALWVYDVAEDAERQVEGSTEEGHITDAERDRRERMREAQTGVVTYAA